MVNTVKRFVEVHGNDVHANQIQESSPNTSDDFSPKEKALIVARVKFAALVMTKLPVFYKGDWTKVVLRLKNDVWRTFIRRIIPKSVDYSSCS